MKHCWTDGDLRAYLDGELPADARASIGLLKCMVCPSSWISPSSGMVAPDRHLISEDLPAPLSPMTARISPARTSKSAPSSAVTWP